jgi:hypothetical protein
MPTIGLFYLIYYRSVIFSNNWLIGEAFLIFISGLMTLKANLVCKFNDPGFIPYDEVDPECKRCPSNRQNFKLTEDTNIDIDKDGNPMMINYNHHCSTCGRCVFMKEHHCFFTSNCIGIRTI